MKKITPILVLATILAITSVFAAEQSTISLLSTSSNSLHLKFESSPINFVEVETEQGLMQIPLMEGASPMLLRGAPDLQKMAASYIIPKNAQTSFRVIASSYKDYEVEIAPSKGNLLRNLDPTTVNYVFGKQYQTEGYFPGDLAEIQDSYILRDFEGQAIWFYPMQYDAENKRLRVYSEIEVQVNFNTDKQVRYPNEMDRQFKGIYEKQFINFAQLERYDPVDEEGAMLIIADAEFIDPMQAFIDWKIQKGIPTEIVDVANIGNEDAVKTYIQNYYQENDLTYVLFVGDHQHIPAYSMSAGYSDNYYAYLAGDDSYPEIFVGRFSVEDKSQVAIMVDRVLNYEQTPPANGAYGIGVGVGSDQGPGDDGEFDYQHLRNIREQLVGYTYNTVHELYDGSQGGEDADGSPNANDLHQIIESGLGLINYTGHGSTMACSSSGYNVSNVNTLTNTEVHPYFFSVACVNGNFTSATCFAEAWLRASHNGQPTGAIATLMSTINQSWSPPMEGQDAMNAILTENDANTTVRSFGAIAMHGCMQMNDTYGSSGASMTDTWTVFGDPSVVLRTDEPQQLLATYDSTIPVGATFLDVSCTVEGALISITLDGEIIGTAIATNGSATVEFNPLNSVGNLNITVTAFNTIPHIGTTSVIVLDGPWLVVTSYELGGDEDGMASYNENFPLYFTIENIGTEATSEIYVNTETSGAIGIGTYGDNIPALEPGESFTYNDEYFWTNVSWNAIDGEEAQVTFSMNSDEGTWYSTINIPVHAPVLEVSSVDADLSFGETTVAIITLTNNGTADFNGGIASLVSAGTYVTVLNDITIEALASGESINIEYEVSLVADAPSSTSLDLSLVVTEGWFEQSTAVELETPMCQSSDLDIELTIMTDTWGSETSWDFTNGDGVVLASAEAGAYESSSTYTATVCAAEGSMMTFNIQDTYGDGIFAPNGYWITVCGNEVAQGDAFGSGTSHTFVVTCDVYIEIPGCMDPEADNYNPEANTPDDSCAYTIDCDSANGLQLFMYDSYGDGWNGNYFELYDLDGIQLVNTTLESGSSGAYDFCLNDGCYSIVTTDAGSWTYEVSWILVSGVDTLATGVSPSSTSISLNEDCGFVFGCIDASACNYNADANVDDSSCTYAAAYYDCEGNCLSDIDGDGYCDELEIYGCMDSAAPNYNPEATEDDGSCLEPIDCEGLTTVTISMLDSYGDGWNGNILTIDSQSFTLDSGSGSSATACIDLSLECIAVACDGGSWQSEVSWTISEGDAIFLSGGAPYNGGIGDCGNVTDAYGCTDATASNYNAEATIDDGSCEYEECICPEVWDPVCGVDGITYGNSCEADCVGIEYTEGECIIVMGCTDATAINYNPEATEDDGSCEYDSTGCAEGQIEDCNGNCAPTSWVGDGFCDDGGYSSGGNQIYFTCEEFDFDGGDCGDVTIVYGCTDATALNYNPEANTDDGSCEYEQTEGPWDILITGSNHTIAVGGETPIIIEDMPIDNGDWIGVFYTDDNGDLQCAGYAIWDGVTTAIAAQGDDSTTEEMDGFQAGEQFVWMIWDASENIIYNANATYLAAMPSQGDFVINGITGLETLSTAPAISEQEIVIPEGWSLFSTYILAEDMSLDAILEPIVEDLVIAKNNGGMAYLPDWAYNGVGLAEVGQGYQLKMSAQRTLMVGGLYMTPEDNPIALDEGWNMIGYLRTTPADCQAVFEEVSEEVVIVKNYEGLAYLPAWGFNGVGDMNPGEGYQVKMNSNQVLTYLANDQEYRMTDLELVRNDLQHFEKPVITGNNMQVAIFDEAWDVLPQAGDEIAVYDRKGVLVGASVYTSPLTLITLWGDDVYSVEKDGLLEGEDFIFEIWNQATEQLHSFHIKQWLQGSLQFHTDAISQVGAVSTETEAPDFSVNLFEILPNPTASKTTLSFGFEKAFSIKIQLFNVLGEMLETISHQDFEKGKHTISFDSSRWDAGTYYIGFGTDDYKQTKKLIIL